MNWGNSGNLIERNCSNFFFHFGDLGPCLDQTNPGVESSQHWLALAIENELPGVKIFNMFLSAKTFISLFIAFIHVLYSISLAFSNWIQELTQPLCWGHSKYSNIGFAQQLLGFLSLPLVHVLHNVNYAFVQSNQSPLSFHAAPSHIMVDNWPSWTYNGTFVIESVYCPD